MSLGAVITRCLLEGRTFILPNYRIMFFPQLINHISYLSFCCASLVWLFVLAMLLDSDESKNSLSAQICARLCLSRPNYIL